MCPDAGRFDYLHVGIFGHTSKFKGIKVVEDFKDRKSEFKYVTSRPALVALYNRENVSGLCRIRHMHVT